MHYGGDYNQKNPFVYTMIDKATRRPVQENLDLSQQDFEMLNLVYPPFENDDNDRQSSVLVLNSRNGWKQAVLIDTKGNNDELTCFERDPRTEAYNSCSINWQNQVIIFGGDKEKRQISRLDGLKLKRIGSLDFNHNKGACSVMNEKIHLCFSSRSR